MANYTNDTQIALPLAAFLASDDYDYQEGRISVTTLMKSVRQIVLGFRQKPESVKFDIAELVSSRMGSAIHTAIEDVWTNPKKLVKALRSLGYSNAVIQRIIVNPSEERLAAAGPMAIPVYLERRSELEIEGFIVSGKFDFVADSRVEDFKSTSVYGYMNQTNAKKYILQGSLYRLLNQDIIKQDVMRINYVFTDWSKAAARKDPRYPATRVLSQVFPLMSLQETEDYARKKLIQVKQLSNAAEEHLPHCTDEDLWRDAAVYKYYKNPDKTARSSGNFDSYADALSRYTEDGSVGMIKEVKGKVKACKYCKVASICTQKDTYLADGSLTLD